MKNPILVLAFFILLWLLNYVASYLYLKKVNEKIIFFKKKYYHTENFLGAAVEKTNKVRKVMMILVVDSAGKIVECEYLYGFTNFSKFKVMHEIIGSNIKDIHNYSSNKFYKALSTCVNEVKIQIESYEIKSI